MKSHSARFKRGERGQSAVEFVLAIPIVLVLMAGIVEFGQHFYARLTVRDAVAEAARFAVTGQQLTNPQNGQQMSRAQSIVQVINTRANQLNLGVNSIQITPPNGGGPDEVVQITASYRYTFVMAPIARLFGSGFVDFSVATSVKNEPSF